MGINIKKQDGTTEPVQSIAEPEAPSTPTLPVIPDKKAEAAKAVDVALSKETVAKNVKMKPGMPLSEILKLVRKDKGDGVVMTGSEVPDCQRIPTGVFEFDNATGGGIPESRISIIYGPESSGKTNIAMKAAGTVQRRDPKIRKDNKVVFVDAEGTFDKKWAANFCDPDQLIVVKPAYGEEAVDLVDAMIRAQDVGLLIYDSVAVTVSTKEIEQSAENFDVGTSAILVKRMVNKLAVALGTEARIGHTPAVILLNQTRFKIGVMFGDPETMPGGNTMKFLSSLTVRLYGKNEMEKAIHPDLPAWKDTNAVIKKAKVGVTAVNFTYKMAMIPCGDIDVGDTNSFNAVSSHLKSMGRLFKDKEGWVLVEDPTNTKKNSHWKTLVTLEEQYICDPDFRVRLQQEVIRHTSANKFLVEGKDAASGK